MQNNNKHSVPFSYGSINIKKDFRLIPCTFKKYSRGASSSPLLVQETFNSNAT